MLPVMTAFMAAHQLKDVTVVADAGMISEASQHTIEDAGLSFILGTRIPDVPYAVAQWRRELPGQGLSDGQIFTQPWPAAGAQKAAGRRTSSSTTSTAPIAAAAPCGGSMSRSPRPRRPSRASPRSSGTGSSPCRRPEFSEPRARGQGQDPGRAQGLHHQPRCLPGGTPVTAEFVISTYHQLWRIEKSFRMPKHDLKARPIYHRKRESIDAHLSIVFAALAVTRFIEDRTGLSHPALCPHRPPLPHHPDPRRPAHPDRRRPTTTRPARCPRLHQVTRRCAPT
jgi:hypothetical protein